MPGTLDENVRFLLRPTWEYPTYDPEYYVEDYGLFEGEMFCCQDFVPVAAWTDEEQIIDVKRFITDKGYIFKEYDTDEWKRASQKDLFKYYDDIRKNGLFNYKIEVSNEVVTSEFMELYFFR